MAHAVYVLCALTSLLCAILLTLSHRRKRGPLLFYGALCFYALAANNFFLLCDLVLAPERDFAIARNLSGAIAVSFMLFGLLWKARPGDRLDVERDFDA